MKHEVVMGSGFRTCKYCKSTHFGSTIHRCDQMDRALGRPTVAEEVELRRKQRKIPKHPKSGQGSRTEEEIRQAVERVRDSKLPKQAQEGLEKLGEKIAEEEWKEIFTEAWKVEIETGECLVEYLMRLYCPPKLKEK